MSTFRTEYGVVVLYNGREVSTRVWTGEIAQVGKGRSLITPYIFLSQRTRTASRRSQLQYGVRTLR